MAGRLRRSDPAGPGIRRQRWGRGFRYRTGDEPVDEIHGGALRFRYPAKGGIERNVQVRDDLLVSLVRSLRRGRADDERLLVYRDGGALGGSLREVRAVLMAGAPEPTSKAGRARAEAAVMRDVAEQLGNTPAVARRSYVDPRVLAAYERGDTIADTLSALEGADLAAARETVERAVITLLSDEGRE